MLARSLSLSHTQMHINAHTYTKRKDVQGCHWLCSKLERNHLGACQTSRFLSSSSRNSDSIGKGEKGGGGRVHSPPKLGNYWGPGQCSMTAVAQVLSICPEAWVKYICGAGSVLGTYRYGLDLNISRDLPLRSMYVSPSVYAYRECTGVI